MRAEPHQAEEQWALKEALWHLEGAIHAAVVIQKEAEQMCHAAKKLCQRIAELRQEREAHRHRLRVIRRVAALSTLWRLR
jgi:predicted  nucleic acid-binding Zn-ribbon protein